MGKPSASNKSGSVILIICCGLPGSGKSTLSKYLSGKSWEVVSQDELGTQNECVKVLEKALKKKKSVILDRCCVTASERKLWARRARAVEPNVIIETVHFDVSPELCKARAKKRTAHPTVDAASASDVIDSFCRGFKKPEKWEGPYAACHTVSDDTQLKWIKARYDNPSTITKTPPPTGAPGTWNDEKDLLKADSSSKKSTSSGMGSKCDVLVLRHAERTDRVLDYRGTLYFNENADDCEITKEGRSQAKKTGEYLAKTTSIPSVAHIYSSPFTRCVQTACEVALQLSIPCIRIEPGLSEFFGARLFHSKPTLNTPTQIERYVNGKGLAVDYSAAPEEPQLPSYPETGKMAKSRVIGTADALRKRHSDTRSILLVTHSHALVEISNDAKSGTVNPRPGYCALSHIDKSGAGLLLTDTSHQSHVAGVDYVGPPSDIPTIPSKGHFNKAWQWTVGYPTASEHNDPSVDTSFDNDGGGGDENSVTTSPHATAISNLLDVPLHTVMKMFPGFGRVLMQGSTEQQQQFTKQWAGRDTSLTQKLATGITKGWFSYKRQPASTIAIHCVRVTQSMDQSVVVGEMCQSGADIIAMFAAGGDYLDGFKKLLTHCNDADLLPHPYIINFLEVSRGSIVGFLVKRTLNPSFVTTLLSPTTTAIIATVLHDCVTIDVCLADYCCSEDVMRAEAILDSNKKSLGSTGPYISAMISQEKVFSAFSELKSNASRPSELTTSGMYCYSSLCDGVSVSRIPTNCDNTIRLTVPDVQIQQGGDFTLMKYPRTRHLYGVGSVGRDDLLMSSDDTKPYHTKIVTVEEKIDGSNLGISFDSSYQVIFQNRGKVIGPSSGTQWNRLEQWYDQHKSELFELLSDRYILFGEWMVARHSISYTQLPDYFIAFDLYDKRASRFLGVAPRDSLLASTSLSVIKPLSQKIHPKKSDILSLLSSTSFYTKATVEGVYLRVDTDDKMWLSQRAKIVNEEFLEGIEEGHWASRVMEKNLLAH